MLRFASDGVSYRKSRLFAVWCARSIWPNLEDRRSRTAVEVAERIADALADHDEHDEAWGDAFEAHEEAGENTIEKTAAAVAADLLLENAPDAAASAADAADVLAHLDVYGDDSVETISETEAASHAKRAVELARQSRSLRDIVGNPFRPVTLAPAFRTPAVLALAQAAYAEHTLPSGELDADRLAVLADALEDAGAAGGILAHLRGPGPHVRGCWALDLALGKE